MKSSLQRLLNWFRIDNPNVVFVAFAIAFFLDSVINYYYDFPLFVLFIMLALPVMWLSLWVSDHKPVFLLIFVSGFGLSVLVNSLFYPFGKKNISDLLFILLFATSFYYYHFFHKKISLTVVNVFLLVATIMIIPEFTEKSANHKSSSRPKTGSIAKQKAEKPKKTITYDKNNKLNRIEKRKNALKGFYRVPHIAAYFFGFLSLLYSFIYFKNKKLIYLVLSLSAAAFVVVSGIRSIVFAILLSFLIYFFLHRKSLILMVLAGLGTLIVLFRFQLYYIIKKTFLKPYLALLVTLFDNTDRQSRLLLWKSWWLEIKNFDWNNFLLGKSFKASRKANWQNIGYKEWFHNDFLSVAFTYGFLCFLIFVGLWVIIWRYYSKFIKGNIFIFVFYFSSIFVSIFNGYYYYFPVILLFMFFLMINEEKKYQSAS